MPESSAEQNKTVPAVPAWRGVAVGRHAVAAGEIQEYAAPTYGVDVHLSRPYQLEWKSGGRFERTLMTASDICIAPAHQPITMRWRDDLEILSVQLEPQVVLKTADDLKVRGQVEIPESHGASDSSVAHLCHALWIEAQAGYPTGRVFGESLSTALAASLLQRHSVRRAAEAPANTLSPRSLRRVREYIEAHLAGDIGLDELARVAELSPYYFARCFKNSVGTTPHQLRHRAPRGAGATAFGALFAFGFRSGGRVRLRRSKPSHAPHETRFGHHARGFEPDLSGRLKLSARIFQQRRNLQDSCAVLFQNKNHERRKAMLSTLEFLDFGKENEDSFCIPLFSAAAQMHCGSQHRAVWQRAGFCRRCAREKCARNRRRQSATRSRFARSSSQKPMG